MGGGPSTIKMVQPPSNNPPSGIYVPPYQGDIANSLYNSVYSQAQSYPTYWGDYTGLVNSAQGYTNQFMTDANAAIAAAPGLANWGNFAGNQMEQFASNIYGDSSTMRGLAAQAMPFTNQLLTTGFDPQQALYNRTSQQIQDQVGAQMAAQGLLGSPYAAGVMGNTLSNFNIDWQNQQLQREIAASQGWSGLTGAMGNLYQGAAGLDTTAAGLQNLGIQTMANSYMLPMQLDQAAISGLSPMMGIYGGLLGNTMNAEQAYLGLGQSAAGLLQGLQANNINAARTNQAGNAGMLGGFGQLAGSALGAGASIYGSTALSDALAGTGATAAGASAAAGTGALASSFAGYGGLAGAALADEMAIATTVGAGSGAAGGGSAALGAGLLAF